MCPKEFETINNYTAHLRNIHVLIPPCSLRCTSGGRMRTFSEYTTLRKQLEHSHNELFVGIGEEIIPHSCNDTGRG